MAQSPEASATFAFEDVLRRTRRARATLRLSRKKEDELAFVNDTPAAGGRVLLDTCVYSDQLKGNAPDAVGATVKVRTVLHLAVALAELAFSFGWLDPQDPRTPRALDTLGRLLAAAPSHRVIAAMLRLGRRV